MIGVEMGGGDCKYPVESFKSGGGHFSWILGFFASSWKYYFVDASVF